jgi:hypothetical protein
VRRSVTERGGLLVTLAPLPEDGNRLCGRVEREVGRLPFGPNSGHAIEYVNAACPGTTLADALPR